MGQHTPKWAVGAVRTTPNPTAYDSKPQTDTERISAARSRAMADCKDNNAPGAQYGFGFPESHYQDFAGLETSNWDANVLVCLAEILEAPILKRSKYVWTHDLYDPRTGQFNFSDTAPVAIEELKAAIDGRIRELGLSKPKLWEWFVYVREPRGQEYWRFELKDRIKKFRD